MKISVVSPRLGRKVFMSFDPRLIVDLHIQQFVLSRRAAISKLKLPQLLRKKNPYLFMARQTDTPSEFAEELVAAALSSSEETMFGDTMERIAIDICAEVFSGQKSAATGIDLEFTRDHCRYVVAIKSGPNWGNSSQQASLRQNFANAIRLIRQHSPRANVIAVNGCCYGRGTFDRGNFVKMCGAPFWELISGDPHMYMQLIAPLREAASNGFVSERNDLLRSLTVELANSWTNQRGHIDWHKVVEHCAGA